MPNTRNMFNRRITLLILCFAFLMNSVSGETWSVPLGGNTFRTEPSAGRVTIGRDGVLALKDTKSVHSVFFHLSKPADLKLAVRARTKDADSVLGITIGPKRFDLPIGNSEFERHSIGEFGIKYPGYLRVDLQLKKGAAEIQSIEVRSDTNEVAVSFVRSNDGNMFYWGRRGPSVHLRYDVPRQKDLVYAYSELTVPEGEDPIGSYFMANGFAQGYFGMQVNSPTERRVLFSVWSPFKTDNPKEIPADQRIVCLGHGKDVHVGQFGNEGSGGQSYLVYPWKAGRTYRFLTEVEPEGNNITKFTSWFGDKEKDEWRLIASFRRPKTDSTLRGFHSFLENFNPATGHIGRRVLYGNVWVRDVEQNWHHCSKTRFSVDATGGGRHRLDYTGGVEGDFFFLRNCGFFNETGTPGESFEINVDDAKPPSIDFTMLPRGK